MSYQEVEQIAGLFLWRCDACGDEQAKIPVPKHTLGRAPHHHCPYEGRPDMKAILDSHAANDELSVQLHLGDIVEEIATKLQGKIDSMNQTHRPQEQQHSLIAGFSSGMASNRYWQLSTIEPNFG
jgi:hypothetical protein